MTQHPLHMHCTRTAWALHTAREALAKAVQREATIDDGHDGLRSPAPSGGRPAGTHADPVGTLALTRPPQTLAELADRTTHTLAWLTRHHAPGPGDGLPRLLAAIPHLMPATARVVTLHLADEDDRIRRALGLPPAGTPLPGECPHCRRRALRAWTDGPAETWTITCTCRCAGSPDIAPTGGCQCGMATRVEGIQHIWPRAAVLART